MGRGSRATQSRAVIGGRFNLWGNGSDMDDRCCIHSPERPDLQERHGPRRRPPLEQARDPTTPAGYSLIPLHAWSHNVTDARAVMEALETIAPGAVDIVTPDVFVARIVASIPH